MALVDNLDIHPKAERAKDIARRPLVFEISQTRTSSVFPSFLLDRNIIQHVLTEYRHELTLYKF